MTDIIKECATHGEWAHKKRTDKNGGYRCRKCDSEAVMRRRTKLKVMAVEYMGGKCSVCDYDKSVTALDFHHVNPAEKDFAISAANVSWERVRNELDKCVMLCANCHREEHERLRQEANKACIPQVEQVL